VGSSSQDVLKGLLAVRVVVAPHHSVLSVFLTSDCKLDPRTDIGGRERERISAWASALTRRYDLPAKRT